MTKTIRALATALLVSLLAVPAFSQAPGDRVIVVQNAPIYAVVGAVSPLRVAAAGTVLQLVSAANAAWLQVRYQDPNSGLRVGFVSARLVRIESASLTPQDLSVPSPVAVPAAVVPTAAPASAQTARATDRAPAPVAQTIPQPPEPLAEVRESTIVPHRAYFGVGLMGVFPLQHGQTITGTPESSSTATTSVAYPDRANAAAFDLTVSFIGGRWGVGARYLQAEYLGVGAISASVSGATGSRLTGILGRKEHILDLPISYTRNERKWRASVFGGPTYFHLSQDMVDGVTYIRVGSTLIMGTPTTEIVDGWTFGGNVGSEFAWFFSKYVGVGGGTLMNFGLVPMTDPLTGDKIHYRVGTTSLTIGPRFRF